MPFSSGSGAGPKVLDRLIQERAESERVIGGMLHPSGNCTYGSNYRIGDRKRAVPARHQPCALRPGPASMTGTVVTA